MFNFGIDKRIIYIILAFFIITNISSYIANPDNLLNLVLTLPAVLIAITFHEFAHAFAADKLGDDTPRRQGRLTLNPLAHLDPIGSVMLVFAGFGWGRPVEINPRKFDRKRTMSAGEAIVSVAGPLMNFILALVFAIVAGIVLKCTNTYISFTSNGYYILGNASKVVEIVIQIIMSCISINIGLGIFNLIPLPPLDGSKILRNFLPYNAKEWMDRNWQMLYIIFVIIWVTPIASMLISDIIGGAFQGISKLIIGIFGRIKMYPMF